MKFLSKILLPSTLAVRLAMAGEPGWLEIPPTAAEWKDAVPATDGRRSALVLDTPGLTSLRAAVLSTPVRRAIDAAGITGLSAELLKRFSETREAALKIEWLDGGAPVSGFSRSFQTTDGRVQSSYRLGDTTITRTVLTVDGEQAVFIHLLANKPGALSFRVSLEAPADAPARIEDRRQLISSPPGGAASHVWVIPFESDVATEGNGIAIRGEGEALVIWSFATGDEARKSLAGTLAKLGERHDPGHSPPDPVRIWHGVLEARLKSPENSP